MVEMTKKELIERLKRTRKLLKQLEWSGASYGQPSYMGSGDEPGFESCPFCSGVKPGGGAEREFTKTGHEKKCKLKKELETP